MRIQRDSHAKSQRGVGITLDLLAHTCLITRFVGSLWDWRLRCLALCLRSGTLPHGLHVPRKQVRRVPWQRRRLPSLTSLRRLPSQTTRIQASPSLRLRSRKARAAQPRLQLWELRREPRLPTSRHPTLSRLRPRCRQPPLRPPTQSPPLRGPREMARLWHPTHRRTKGRHPRRLSPPPRPCFEQLVHLAHDRCWRSGQ